LGDFLLGGFDFFKGLFRVDDLLRHLFRNRFWHRFRNGLDLTG